MSARRAALQPTPLASAGETVGCYVPQAVMHRDGRLLDVDLVLSEAIEQHGGVLMVEYGSGPCAWTSR